MKINTNPTSTEILLCSIANNKVNMINSQIHNLIQEKLVDEQLNITQLGLKRIEKYKVNKVILFAAGKGSRLMPITKTTPKPLIVVKKQPLIERLIEQILNNLKITEINIVVWHLKEQFSYLVDKYSNYTKINLIENFEAEKKNNISSFEKIKNLTEQSYVMDGDIIINGSILNQYMHSSTFFAKYTNEYSKEWMLHTNSQNQLLKVVVGGTSKHYMSGVSFISYQDAITLKKLVDQVYLDPKHQTLYWENLVANNVEQLNYEVVGVKNTDIIELDNLDELIAYDNSWSNVVYDNKAKIKKIAHEIFFVTTDEIYNIEKLSGGITNKTYKFRVNNKWYVIRLPQVATNSMLNRIQEEKIYLALNKVDFCEEVIKYYPQTGIKVSTYFQTPSLNETQVSENITNIAKTLKNIHTSNIQCDVEFNPLKELNKYINLVKQNNLKFYNHFEEIKNQILLKYKELEPTFEIKFCHNDLVCGNILKVNEKIILIDWEYGGQNDLAFEIASLFSENEISLENQDKFWQTYVIEKNSNIKQRVEFWMDFQNLLWSIWHINKQSTDDIERDDYGINRYAKLYKYLTR